ncbi:hypothetical protein FGB62_20g04 [Gracilaria domingensis]|nr:hypothetical protein FGB62_20g04 [Gracilaria domingensis]
MVCGMSAASSPSARGTARCVGGSNDVGAWRRGGTLCRPVGSCERIGASARRAGGAANADGQRRAGMAEAHARRRALGIGHVAPAAALRSPAA